MKQRRKNSAKINTKINAKIYIVLVAPQNEPWISNQEIY